MNVVEQSWILIVTYTVNLKRLTGVATIGGAVTSGVFQGSVPGPVLF